jgi:hypothetical protein
VVRNLAPSVPGLLVTPTLEEVDAVWIDRIGANRQVKTAVVLPGSFDHAGKRFYRSVAFIGFGERISSYVDAA